MGLKYNRLSFINQFKLYLDDFILTTNQFVIIKYVYIFSYDVLADFQCWYCIVQNTKISY